MGRSYWLVKHVCFVDDVLFPLVKCTVEMFIQQTTSTILVINIKFKIKEWHDRARAARFFHTQHELFYYKYTNKYLHMKNIISTGYHSTFGFM